MKTAWCLLLFLAAICFAAAENPIPVPLAQDPAHHLLLENQYTRVWQVTVAPRASTAMHRHDHDYVAVMLAPAEVQIAVEGKPVTTGRAGLGEVRFISAPVTHRITDTADKPFRSLDIEILKKKPAPSEDSQGERGLEIGHGGLSDVVVDNSEVRIQEVQIAPGGMLHKHTHKFPFLVVALSDLELHNMPQGRPARMVEQKAGTVKWIGPGSTHEMMNVGKQEAHFIEVEFK